MGITLLAFFLMLIVLVMVHEAGHYFTARAFGVKIDEVGFFLPPRIWGFKHKDTIYSINWLPFGGFVKMAGEEDPNIPGSLASKSRKVRVAVLGAGAIMNLLLPLILLSIAFMVPHTESTAPSIVKTVVANSPASTSGIRPGDTILKFNGKTLQNPSEFQRDVQLYLGTTVTLELQHSDSTIETVNLVPRWKPPQGQGAIGISFDVDAIVAQQQVYKKSYPFWEAIPLGFKDCMQTFVLFKNGIISMVIGATPAALLGPVGVAQLTGEIIKAGVSPLLEFAAAFSINLGILNLFPLPALDGGRIAFVILEWIRRGKRVSAKTEGLVHMIGFLLLIGLVLFFTYKDILRIITGGSVLP